MVYLSNDRWFSHYKLPQKATRSCLCCVRNVKVGYTCVASVGGTLFSRQVAASELGCELVLQLREIVRDAFFLLFCSHLSCLVWIPLLIHNSLLDFHKSTPQNSHAALSDPTVATVASSRYDLEFVPNLTGLYKSPCRRNFLSAEPPPAADSLPSTGSRHHAAPYFKSPLFRPQPCSPCSCSLGPSPFLPSWSAVRPFPSVAQDVS